MAEKYDWELIRAEYETGSTQSQLSRDHGVSRTAIQKHIRSEGWVQDVSDTINRLTEAKVAGVVTGCNPQKKAQAMDAAASRKAAVILRHQEEWATQQALMDEAVRDRDFDLAKLAKITAETLEIRQKGERRAWGISDKQEMSIDANVQAKDDITVRFVRPGATA